MNNRVENVKKICSFYVSEYHLVTMLLPYVKQKTDNKEKVILLSEQNLKENIEMLLSNINFTSKDKQKIIDLNWENVDVYKFRKLERYLNTVIEKSKNINVIISGKRNYIDVANKNIKMWLEKNIEKFNNINIVDCYEMMQFNHNIKDILDEHDKILNTAGEKEIEDVFEGYDKKDQVNIVNI